MLSVPFIKSGIQDRRLFAVLLICLCASSFDAFATVQHIAHGIAVEFNPLMRYFINLSWEIFFAVKVAITALGLSICYARRDQRLGRWGLWGVTGIYQIIVVYHIYIYAFIYPKH